jgi:hypothetical protein
MTTANDVMEATTRLDADLKKAARGLSRASARRLVDFLFIL